MKTALRLLFVLLLSLPCYGADLYIDLRTNYVPPADFSRVRVELIDQADARQQWVKYSGAYGGSYVDGVRVAEFSHVQTGHSYLLVVKVLDDHMRTVDGRLVILDMSSPAYAATVLMTRR